MLDKFLRQINIEELRTCEVHIVSEHPRFTDVAKIRNRQSTIDSNETIEKEYLSADSDSSYSQIYSEYHNKNLAPSSTLLLYNTSHIGRRMDKSK